MGEFAVHIGNGDRGESAGPIGHADQTTQHGTEHRLVGDRRTVALGFGQ